MHARIHERAHLRQEEGKPLRPLDALIGALQPSSEDGDSAQDRRIQRQGLAVGGQGGPSDIAVSAKLP